MYVCVCACVYYSSKSENSAHSKIYIDFLHISTTSFPVKIV